MTTMLCTRKYVRIVARVCIARERLGSCYIRTCMDKRSRVYRTRAVGVHTQVTREQRALRGSRERLQVTREHS